MASPIISKRSKQRGGRFRVLVGEHLDRGPDGCQCDSCLADPNNHRYRAVVWIKGRAYNPYELEEWERNGRPKGKQGDPDGMPLPLGPSRPYDGDIVDSPVDLVALHNKPPDPRLNFAGSAKFERIGKSSPLPAYMQTTDIDEDEWDVDPAHGMVSAVPAQTPSSPQGGAPAVLKKATAAELKAMSMAELRKMASDLSIDVAKLHKKEDVEKAIKDATDLGA